MQKLTFDEIRKRGWLLYEFIRGSQSQGTAEEGSDVDYGGVFICPTEQILGLGEDYQDQITNETNDICWYEIGKWFKLLINANPTVLETLFVDDKYIIYEHPIIKEIKKHRDLFVTKQCFSKFFAYSRSQIQKAQGLNKLMNINSIEPASPLDFCYTFYNQGSTKLINWLDNHGLYQRYCGLVKVPNMHDVYGVYYDWKAHLDDIVIPDTLPYQPFYRFAMEHFKFGSDSSVKYTVSNMKRLGYSGIVAEDGSSKTLRYIQEGWAECDGIMVNSVEKGAKPICYMSFNAEGYAKHERDYTRYQKWLKERNPQRYENNKGRKYDAKNMLHSFRLIAMGIEIAQGEGVNVNRTNIDRDFLLKVKHHHYSYEELMGMLKVKEQEMKEAMDNSTLPDDVDTEKVNNLLINIRKQFYEYENV